MTDFNTELNREKNATAVVSQIKTKIKEVATNKGISVGSTDTPLSVLSKIDNGTIATPTEQLDITQNGVQDVTNYASVDVNVVTPSQEKTVTPTTSQQEITPDTDYLLSKVTVNAVTSAIDSNITAENIKDGVTILGVEGTLHEGITPTGTLDVTANGTYDVTNYASANVNVPSGGAELPAYMSAKNFTFDGNACTGYVGDNDLPQIIIPQSYSIAEDGSFIDGNDYQVTSVVGDETELTSGFENYAGNVILLDNITNIGPAAFSFCTNLKAVTISKNVTSIGDYAFTACSNLTDITIPAMVSSIGSIAFSQCSNLKNITIINNNINFAAAGTFPYCEFTGVICSKTNANNYNFKNGLLTIIGNISSNPAWQADGIQELILKIVFDVDNITDIGMNTFANCSSLVDITLPSTITSIGDAFYNTPNLTTVRINAITPPTIQKDTFENTVQRYEVPAESVEAYKTATNWANYADKIFAIQTV